MISDSERREVARRLREVRAYVIPSAKTEVHPITGRIIGVACGYDLPDFQGLLGYLADLIEPSCDRDALLSIAKGLDYAAEVAEDRFYKALMLDVAKNIRSACEVER